MGYWMPKSPESYRLFCGEYFWAPAYQNVRGEQIREGAWDQGDYPPPRNLPKPIIVTAQSYLWDGSGYDCSLEDGVSFLAPSPWLARSLDLKWLGKEGEFHNRQGLLATQSPHLYTPLGW